jgi:hypothetical protein
VISKTSSDRRKRLRAKWMISELARLINGGSDPLVIVEERRMTRFLISTHAPHGAPKLKAEFFNILALSGYATRIAA